MATLTREIERPAFLDVAAGGQLALNGVASTARERRAAPGGGGEPFGEPEPPRQPAPASLSGRLRAERVAGAGGVGGSVLQADAIRGGGATLDELLVGAWEGLSARCPVACPVCAGPMSPRAGASGGGCGDCGSQLR